MIIFIAKKLGIYKEPKPKPKLYKQVLIIYPTPSKKDPWTFSQIPVKEKEPMEQAWKKFMKWYYGRPQSKNYTFGHDTKSIQIPRSTISWFVMKIEEVESEED